MDKKRSINRKKVMMSVKANDVTGGVIPKLLLILFISSLSLESKAQLHPESVPDHTPMMNEVWEKINTLMYRVTKEGNETVYTPYFPPDLKALGDQVVELPGYLVPMHSGRNHDTFMLSVLPIMQCMFCGQNEIPPMIEVFMKKGSVRFTEDPIRIRGKMYLNPDITKGNSEIQILEAEIVQN